jgi:rhomboid family GlyGly-CTERM serine protease
MIHLRSICHPIAFFALPAALVAFLPSVGERLVLDRAALMDGGEIWRLWTGHWVHFSTSHLAWNLLVLLVAGTWLERVRPGLLLRNVFFAAPLIGLAVLAGEPRLHSYGGLSGLATGVVVLLALHQVRAPGAPRLVWTALLALVAAKSVHDLAAPDALFASYDLPGVRTSATAHAAGATVALLHYSLARWRNCGRGALTPPTGVLRPLSRLFASFAVHPPTNGTAGTRDGFPAARFRLSPLTTRLDTPIYYGR